MQQNPELFVESEHASTPEGASPSPAATHSVLFTAYVPSPSLARHATLRTRHADAGKHPCGTGGVPTGALRVQLLQSLVDQNSDVPPHDRVVDTKSASGQPHPLEQVTTRDWEPGPNAGVHADHALATYTPATVLSQG